MLTVFTCVFGFTDPLHEPECETKANMICFTDQPITSDRWDIVKIPHTDAPTRMARMKKALSHLTTSTEWSLWLDANFTLMVDPLTLMDHGEFVAFNHRDRSNIEQEAAEIIRLGKAKPDAIKSQLKAYQDDGFCTPENPQTQLSSNSAILRRHTLRVQALNNLWSKEIASRTLRDQMSLDYCAWKVGQEIKKWPGVHSDNPYFRHQHYKRPVNDY